MLYTTIEDGKVVGFVYALTVLELTLESKDPPLMLKAQAFVRI